MLKMSKKLIAYVSIAAIVCAGLPVAKQVEAAKKPKLSKKSATIYVGASVKLKVKNNKKKVKWSSSAKKVAIVSKKGVVRGIAVGKCKITAKVGKKKLKCSISVIAPAVPTRVPQPIVQPTPIGNSDVDPNYDPDITPGPGYPEGPSVNPTQGPGVNPTQGPSVNPTQGPSVNPTPVPGVNPTQGPSVNPTEAPSSGGVDLGDKTVFTAGAKKLALGITKAEVKQIFGNTGSIREETSPQGFDTIVYTPKGTYNAYSIVYLKNDAVVSICAIGNNVSYGSHAKTGDTAAYLTSNGFAGDTWYKVRIDGEGQAEKYGAYKKVVSGSTIIAYVDYMRTQNTNCTTYCIQVIDSSKVSYEDLQQKTSGNTYNTTMFNNMQKQVYELFCAYWEYYDEPSKDFDLNVAKSENDLDGNIKLDGPTDAIGFANMVVSTASSESSSIYRARDLIVDYGYYGRIGFYIQLSSSKPTMYMGGNM